MDIFLSFIVFRFSFFEKRITNNDQRILILTLEF
jgi:hypothetical protein